MAAHRISDAASTPARRPRASAAISPTDSDPRRVMRALGRELARLQAADSKLAAAEMSIDELRREKDSQKKRTNEVEQSVATLTETLEAIKAIRHGKRVDRRLAKAQRLAERGLRRAQAKKGSANR